MRLTDQQAKALGITATQIKKARLAPATAKITPEAAQRDGRAILHAALVLAYPGEVESKYRVQGDGWGQTVDFALPRQKIAILFNVWGERESIEELRAHFQEAGWRLVQCADSPLASTRDRKAALDLAMGLVSTAYGLAEKKRDVAPRTK